MCQTVLKNRGKFFILLYVEFQDTLAVDSEWVLMGSYNSFNISKPPKLIFLMQAKV